MATYDLYKHADDATTTGVYRTYRPGQSLEPLRESVYRAEVMPLSDDEVERHPRVVDLATMAELPDEERTRAKREARKADPLRRDKVSPESVAELEAAIGAVIDPAAKAAFDKLARIVAKGYTGV